MIQVESILSCTDNTGAKSMQCIKVLGGSKKRYAKIGDIIVVAIKEAIPKGIIKSGTVQRAVIVRVKKSYKRADGSYIKYDDNAAVIVDKDGKPKGTRIFGPISRELRDKNPNFMKIISLAPEVL